MIDLKCGRCGYLVSEHEGRHRKWILAEGNVAYFIVSQERRNEAHRALQELEDKAERLATVREIYDAGWNAAAAFHREPECGPGPAPLNKDQSYVAWLRTRRLS